MNDFCYYCERQVFIHLTTPHPYLLKTRDHIVPLCHQGTSHPSNLVTACALCNHIKGMFSLKKFSKIVGDYRKKYFEIEFDAYLIIKIRSNISILGNQIKLGSYSRKPSQNLYTPKTHKFSGKGVRAFDNRGVNSNTSTMASRYKGETAAEFLYKRQLECNRFNALNAPEENFHEPE